MPTPPENSFDIWQSIGFGCSAAFGWIVSKVWTTRGLLGDLQHRDGELQAAITAAGASAAAEHKLLTARVAVLEKTSDTCRQDLRTIIRDVIGSVQAENVDRQSEALSALRDESIRMASDLKHLRDGLDNLMDQMEDRRGELDTFRSSLAAILQRLDIRHEDHGRREGDRRHA